MIKKNLTDFKSGYEYAIRLLARADYTSKMVEDKLISRGLLRETAKEITERLENSGIIDNLDYGRKFIEDSCNLKAKGKKYIEFELSKKGLSKEDISSLLSEFYKPNTDEAIKKHIRKLNKPLNELDFKELNSLKSKLLRMGYSFEEISAAIGGYEDNCKFLETEDI